MLGEWVAEFERFAVDDEVVVVWVEELLPVSRPVAVPRRSGALEALAVPHFQTHRRVGQRWMSYLTSKDCFAVPFGKISEHGQLSPSSNRWSNPPPTGEAFILDWVWGRDREGRMALSLRVSGRPATLASLYVRSGYIPRHYNGT